ncbi:hypothetical protein BTS2_1455 [Bacillus sp. TS-2]|nr:hypothetical protein BTS2_1455 [Bacillus sp. TS-2]
MKVKYRSNYESKQQQPYNSYSLEALKSDNLKTIRQLLAHSDDFVFQTISFKDEELTLIYSSSMIDLKQLNDYLLPKLSMFFDEVDTLWDEHYHSLALSKISSNDSLFENLLSGNLLIFYHDKNQFYFRVMSNVAKRETEESATEISVKGPRDGFTEDIHTNISLIRKRLKTPLLKNKMYDLGKKSQTVAALFYLEGTISSSILDQIIQKLDECDIEYVESSQQLEEYLGNGRFSLFPLVNYGGRADIVVQSLKRGRFALIIDGSPMVLIAPTNLTEQIKSPEDYYNPFYFVALERLLRVFGLLVSVFLPGFWVGISTYNVEQIPFHLLATISNSRFGIPFSGPMEAFLMIWMFEIFREAGVRLPKSVGQTIAVIGGLIVGDAAIRAGLTSPTLLVVMAVSTVAQFTLINQSLIGTVTLLRLFILIISSFLGMFGFFVGLFITICYAAGLTSFGVGYLEPLSPVTFRDLITAVLDKPKSLKVHIPNIITKKKG